MSQDTAHLFSVRKPLGVTYNTGIPQPASALKRSSSISGMRDSQVPFTGHHGRSQSQSRLSLAPNRPPQPSFHRSSSGDNLAGMGKSTAQRGSTSNNFNGRMSYAPGTSTPFGQQPQLSASQSLQRRSSIYSRPSTSAQALGQQSFFVQAPIAAGVPADKRRLKDRGVQTEMARQLEEYLNQNNFQMEMKHQLNPKSFLSPTQKDFNMMFQWLYKRIDPGYKFEKSIDAEVPPILKQLRYPFERSISKSQLMAVGGQNWWTFLGMLHWLMQLAQMMERFAEDRYDDALLQEDIDVTPDRISFRFLSRAYQTWLTCPPGEDEEEEEADKMLIPFVNEMAAEFDRSNAQYIEELKMLEAAHEALENQIAEAEKSANELEKLHEVNKIVESDLKKFEEYGANIQQKLKKRETQNQMLKNDIESWEKQLNEAAKERSDLQEAVDRQGISIQDIDRMNGERIRLQQGVDAAKARLDELAQTIKDKETDASTKLAELENLVRQYNTLCYEVGIRDKEFELELNISDVSFGSSQMGASQHGAGDRLLANGDSGYHPSSILNLDLRGKVKSYINTLRKEINSKRHAAKEQDEDNRRLLFELSGAIDDKKLEIEALDHRVRSAEEEFEKTKETTTTQKLESDAQIEKMEKELAKMRAGLQDSVQLMEQREMNTNIEYEQLTLRANNLREELHTEIERMLNDIIKFKVHIQKSLEDYEGFVVEEVEEELGGDEGSMEEAMEN